MRFLVDAQLPPSLARYLNELGHESDHVVHLGLESATDRDVWDFAAAQAAVIVTKDEDFVTMRSLREQGPAVIWIRIGNTTTPTLLETFSAAWPAIAAALERGESVIEVT